VWNSSRAATRLLRKSTTATPHFNCSLRPARGTPSIADVLRIFDRPTKAYGPTSARPRAKPGSSATGWRRPVAGSTSTNCPVPDSRSHSPPSRQRGEGGIDRPRLITSPLVTSTKQPPCDLLARQPLAESVSPRAVTYLGRPAAMARPLRWHRSSAARAETNGGCHRGTKL